jgi:filamentous hemagglutinin family protein
MMPSVKPVLRRQRSKLFVSCAVLAMATAIALPQKANAQAAPGAFQGNPTTAIGTVTYDRGSVGSETITVGSANATINWSPYDTTGTGPIDFLPQGYVATFINDPNLTSDYTVLNRIVPTDPSRTIVINGQIFSQITDGINASTGGHVWFYSPGGILIGAQAVIDVGALLLTTADLPNGFTAGSNGFSAYFSAPSGSTSAIHILDGAQINALQQNSYVALIAPRIEQGGNVQVNGSAGYFAGEQMTMSFSQGLFDVSIDLGTEDVNGIVHTGTTGGPASTGADDPHRIYMAAVPKNQAMTMLLGGNVGFDPAVSASIENGEIKLSAGWTPYSDASGTGFQTFDTNSDAGIQISNGNFSSSVEAIANSDILAGTLTGDLAFRSDVSLWSFNRDVMVEATSNGQLDVVGSLSLLSTGDGGTVGIDANSGGVLNITGSAGLTATGAFGHGGNAYVDALGGTVNINGILSANVDGIGTSTIGSTDGVGGSIDIQAANAGVIDVGGMSLSANGVGVDAASGTAGDGRGGTITVNTNGGLIDVHGNFNAVASGFGGGQTTSSLTGGQAQGGEIHVGSSSDACTFTAMPR